MVTIQEEIDVGQPTGINLTAVSLPDISPLPTQSRNCGFIADICPLREEEKLMQYKLEGILDAQRNYIERIATARILLNCYREVKNNVGVENASCIGWCYISKLHLCILANGLIIPTCEGDGGIPDRAFVDN